MLFDAVSQKRCYRDAMTIEDSFSIIEKGIGTDFDPHLAQIFLDNKDEVVRIRRIVSRNVKRLQKGGSNQWILKLNRFQRK